MKNTNINLNEHLTEHFTLRELVISGTALRRNIENTPGPDVIECLRRLCQHVLEPLRMRFGVIRITSGYRCKALNKAVGGSMRSQHMLGEAADLHVTDREVIEKMVNFAREHIEFDQLLLERNRRTGVRWIHISYTTRHRNRKMVLNLTV